jgi:hypothetical protein
MARVPPANAIMMAKPAFEGLKGRSEEKAPATFEKRAAVSGKLAPGVVAVVTAKSG